MSATANEPFGKIIDKLPDSVTEVKAAYVNANRSNAQAVVNGGILKLTEAEYAEKRRAIVGLILKEHYKPLIYTDTEHNYYIKAAKMNQAEIETREKQLKALKQAAAKPRKSHP
jgi:Iap family predicted aminopeptidase